MTIRDRLIAALELKGWTIDTTARSRKYTVMVKVGREQKAYIGKAGSFRTGLNIASSVQRPVIKAKLLREEPKWPT